jgi:hypothetical protein
MSRKQFGPTGSSHEKKMTRKERKVLAKENPITTNTNEQPLLVTAPTESEKKQLRNLTILGIAGIVVLMLLMYYAFISS